MISLDTDLINSSHAFEIQGKGLGKMFLRHLRRTRMLVHVIDCTTESVESAFRDIRDELRLYNLQYLDKPYVIAVNKIDLLLDQNVLA